MSRSGATGAALAPWQIAERLGDNRLAALGRAFQNLGSSSGDNIYTVNGTDFGNANDFAFTAAAGAPTAALSVADRSGVLLCDTSATAGSNGFVQPPGPVSLIDDLALANVHAEFRVAWTSAAGADSTVGCKLFHPNGGFPQVFCGLAGTIHATQLSYFVLGNAGAVCQQGATGVVRDAAYHRVAFDADGTNLKIRIDGVVVATIPVAAANFPSASMTWGLGFFNGTGAVSRTLAVDNVYVCTENN